MTDDRKREHGREHRGDLVARFLINADRTVPLGGRGPQNGVGFLRHSTHRTGECVDRFFCKEDGMWAWSDFCDGFRGG